MKILISNDDGIHAEGIKALVEALRDEHELYIAAPSSERSAFSHSVTYFRMQNKAEKVEMDGVNEAWAIDGTPADCVYYAMCGLFDVTFDVVIAGINNGRNMSADIIYSGTVGAAGEGMLSKVPSMAVSLCGKPRTHYETAGYVAKILLPEFMKDEGRLSYIMNINVPNVPVEELKGIRITIMDIPEDYRRPLTITKTDENTCILSMDIDIHRNMNSLAMPDGDVTAVNEGYVSVTPLMYDMVRYGVIPKLKRLEDMKL